MFTNTFDSLSEILYPNWKRTGECILVDLDENEHHPTLATTGKLDWGLTNGLSDYYALRFYIRYGEKERKYADRNWDMFMLVPAAKASEVRLILAVCVKGLNDETEILFVLFGEYTYKKYWLAQIQPTS